MDKIKKNTLNTKTRSKVVEALNMLQNTPKYKGERIRTHTLITSLTDLLSKTGNKSKEFVNYEVANRGYKLSIQNGGNGDCFTFYKKNSEGFDINLFNFRMLPYKGDIKIYNDLQNDDFFEQTQIKKEIFQKEINKRI